MIAFFKNLLWDQSAFERYTRAALFTLAGMAATGAFDGVLPKWLVVACMGFGGLIGAGQKNP